MAENPNVSLKQLRKGPQSFRQAEEVGLLSSRNWTQPEIVVLLREYKKRECLYDMTNASYRNKFARQQALDDIANILCKIRPQTTGVDVKLKFNILRTQYHAELSKEKKAAEEGKCHVITLWFMDHIKFVRGHNRREIREKWNQGVQGSEPMVEVRYEDQASLSEDYFVESNDNYDDFDPGDTEGTEDPLSNRKKRDISTVIKTERSIDAAEGGMASDSQDDKEDEETNERHQPASRKIREPNDLVQQNPAHSSEEDLFGQIVAKKLKKITNPKKRADAEFKIFSILHSALVEEFDS